MNRSLIAKSVFATVIIAALFGASIPASASEVAESAPTAAPSDVSGAVPELDDATISAAFADLQASDAPRTETQSSGKTLVTFTLPTGSTLTFERNAIQPMLGGGYGQWGLYVDFNRTDQSVLLAGGGAALAAALCFIPGVGIPLCIVAAAVVGAATTALAAQGLCRGTMRVWAQLFGFTECV